MNVAKFPDIGQYRTTVYDVVHRAKFFPDGAERHIVQFPVITFTGTVKLHGTNAGIELHNGHLFYQARTRRIISSDDNLGFAAHMEQHEQEAIQLFEGLRKLGVDISRRTIIYGEWAGQGIQKGVGINQLPFKAFFIFAVRCADYWLSDEMVSKIAAPDIHIFNIFSFPVYSVTVDFAHPELSQNKFVEITQAVEAHCPVAAAFGISGIGEGVVWSANLDDPITQRIYFKVKGDKHSVTKVKKLASVDIEKLNTVNAFVDAVVTENRLQQGIDQLQQEHLDVSDIRNMGVFLKWIANDVFKEEHDTMIGNGLVEKDVGKAISIKARIWLTEHYIRH